MFLSAVVAAVAELLYAVHFCRRLRRRLPSRLRHRLHYEVLSSLLCSLECSHSHITAAVTVSRYDLLRLITALAAYFNFDLHQLDIKTAFLNGQLDEEIWMSPPPGIGLSGKVLRLCKALYGLKQAPLQ